MIFRDTNDYVFEWKNRIKKAAWDALLYLWNFELRLWCHQRENSDLSSDNSWSQSHASSCKNGVNLAISPRKIFFSPKNRREIQIIIKLTAQKKVREWAWVSEHSVCKFWSPWVSVSSFSQFSTLVSEWAGSLTHSRSLTAHGSRHLQHWVVL